MGKGGRLSIPGGCLGGTLGGLLGIGLGGWITYTTISAEMELPEPGTPGMPLLVLMQVYIVAYGLLVLPGAIAGGMVGAMGGSLIGSVVFSKRHATTRDTADETDIKRSEPRHLWVNGAIYGLVALGLLWVLIATLMLNSGEHNTLSIAFLLWGLMGVASGILLSKRIRAARVLGIVFALPGLLVFPYGTVIAPLVVYALCRAETTRYLSGNWG